MAAIEIVIAEAAVEAAAGAVAEEYLRGDHCYSYCFQGWCVQSLTTVHQAA